jgi:hypothetical protein
MNAIDELRTRAGAKTTVHSTEGDFTGYVLTKYLTDESAYALVAETPETSPDKATVISMGAITAVEPA